MSRKKSRASCPRSIRLGRSRFLAGGFDRRAGIGRLADFFEVLLHELLIIERDFVAMDLLARLNVRGLALRPLGFSCCLLEPTSTITSPVTFCARLPSNSLIFPIAASCAASRAALSPSEEPMPLFESG